MEHLFDKLRKNAEEGSYPYHMPGHKRRPFDGLPEDAMYGLDITEIEGFDNLHQPEGILRTLQERAARLYGAEESFCLVNGSTCGILAAVSSAIPAGGRILMARNCHRSAYHAAYLRNLSVGYICPQPLAEYGILEAVAPDQVREALEREQGAGAVLIVSPTYEGRIADVAAIADIVHEKGIPLIVDEAHGAHLGLAEGFPPNGCQAGADLVVHSVHKTLPALTQTALLHRNGNLVSRDLVRRFLRIYQSSSPSYLLMASVDRALQFVEEDGKEAFGRFREQYGKMMGFLGRCQSLKCLAGTPERQDIGKLLVSVGRTGLTGRQLYDILLQEYRLQAEMASESFVLAMFTVRDEEEAYRRMTEALLEIDGRFPGGTGGDNRDCTPCDAAWAEQEDAVWLAEAWDGEAEWVALEDSVGRYLAEFVNLCPPGIPLLAPGERMTENACRAILEAVAQGLAVQGISIQEGRTACGRGISVKTLVGQQAALQSHIIDQKETIKR